MYDSSLPSEFATPTALATPCYRPHPDEMVAWAERTLHQTRGAGRSRGYIPRYVRTAGADRHVPVVSILGFPPSSAVSGAMAQARDALRRVPAHVHSGIRFLADEDAHLSYQWIPAGLTPDDDAAALRAAHGEKRAFERFLRGQQDFELVVDGLTMSNRQLMATYRVNDGWHEFVSSSATWSALSRHFRVPYDPSRGPLQPNGRLLQTTLAVFDDDVPLDGVVEAITPYLPGRTGFEPVEMKLDSLTMAVMEFDQDYGQRTGEVVTRVEFASARRPIAMDSLVMKQ